MLNGSEHGASAVLIAAAMVLLVGVTAVALDVSAAFNEDHQDQNAADNGVMAGALEKAEPSPDEQTMVTETLEFVRSNLTAEFTGPDDPAWIALWEGCSDSGNPGWLPLAEPTAWGSGTLDCISQTTSLLRVRVPDQLTDAPFSGLVGTRALSTHAVAIAKAALSGNAPPVVPFGVNSGAGPGETCLSSASSGTAYPPCTGSQTGAFGPIVSPWFGDFGTHAAQCNGNTLRWFERNLVWGLDHQLSPWPGAAGVPNGSPWPGQPAIDALTDLHQDECVLDPDGNATPQDGIPINGVKVDTGFPDPAVTNALVSNQTFDGLPSRLQLPTTATRPLMNQNTAWNVDDVGPWAFLTDDVGNPMECRHSSYSSLTTTADKTAMFAACLGSAPAGEIFLSTITSSPRFVWAPEYVYDSPPGSKFNPIRGFRPMFLAGVWFNCPNPNSGNPCGAVFYPDKAVTAPVCDGVFPSCKKLTVDQISTWILPDSALPQSVKDSFAAAFDNKEAELYQ